MKKIFTSALAALALAIPAMAQVSLPESLDGFYRLTNPAFNESMTATGSYELGGALPSPASLGSIFSVKTDVMFSFANEMNKLQEMLDNGQITDTQYYEMFMNLMNVDSWKSGTFPLTKFASQTQDYMSLMQLLPDYADEAIEDFLNNDIPALYAEHRSTLTLLCVFAIDIIKPGDLETEDTFRAWAERYLTKWRQVADFGLYLNPVYALPEGADEETTTAFTGEYYIEFKTPPYVGNMEKAQTYINNMLTNNGAITDVDTLNIWASAKEYMLKAMSRDYPVSSPEYKFVDRLISPTKMNMTFMLGETENGEIEAIGLPDAFGTNGVVLTADDVARSTWNFEIVNEQSPAALQPNAAFTDSEGWYYTGVNSPYALRILSPDVEAYYATSVGYDSHAPELVKITSDVIPAETPVIIRSKSTNLADNKVLPVVEVTEGVISDNVLKGVLWPEANTNHFATLDSSTNGPVFSSYPSVFSANTIYYDGEMGVSSVTADNEEDETVYDLHGRIVKNPTKGVFIVNGKKVVK